MASLTDFLASRRSDLLEAIRLEEVEATKDPEEEPYRSQYAARAIFSDLLESLPQPEEVRSRAVAAAVTSRLGANLFDTEERPEGEAKLTEAVRCCSEAIAEVSKDTPLFVTTLIQTLNTLSRLSSAREAYKEALVWLKKAEKLHEQFKEDGQGAAPISFETLLGLGETEPTDKGEWRLFEALHTRTLYFLAQVHCKIEGNAAISAHYCGATLSRQLQAGEYDPLDWCLNAGGLSQFFLTRCRFAAARHCLATAEAMFQEQVVKKPGQEELVDQGRADLNRCWAKYALFLLDPASIDIDAEEANAEELEQVSKKEKKREQEAEKEVEAAGEEVGAGDEEKDPANTSESPRSEEDSDAEREKQMREDVEAAPHFTALASIEQHERLIGCARPDSLETARPLFLFAQERLELAKKHYLLEELCSDHVAVVQDHSRAFKLLAEHWEPQVERQCRMHKRRLDMLRVLIAALNPQHFLMLCRQLLFEMGETLQSMVTAKLSVLPSSGSDKEKMHAIKKVNALATEGISFYQRFLESFKRPNGTMPEEFPLEETRAALLAYFHMGHLHSKRIEFDKGKRIGSIEASLAEYRKVVDYCQRYPDARSRLPVELDLAKEMVQLLPGKIRQVALDRSY